MDSFSSLDVVESVQEEISDYLQLQLKFRKACSQVVLLNNSIREAQTRYDRANKSGNKPFRYVGRLKLAVIEGVRNTIYEYAALKADELDVMQERLVELGVMEHEHEVVDSAQ
jgi:hypothetical protein